MSISIFKKVKFVIRLSTIAVLVILITGCATVENYKYAVNSWQGGNADQLIRTWGYPKHIQQLPNGHHLYTYRYHVHGRTPITTIPAEREVIKKKHGRKIIRETGPVVMGGETYDWRCNTWFEVDNQKRIVAANFYGDHCVATDQEKQNLSRFLNN